MQVNHRFFTSTPEGDRVVEFITVFTILYTLHFSFRREIKIFFSSYRRNIMKRLLLLFLFAGIALLYFGCSENNPVISESSQSNQVINTLAKKPAPSLQCTIVYWYVGHLGTVDGEGRLHVWDGEIHGDIEGQIKWWFVPGGGPPTPTAQVRFYDARWEIWDGNDLLLAGESAGSTATPQGSTPEKNGIWRGNGRVTETSTGFEDWYGRHTYEGGNVSWVFPFSGEGIVRIN
jgi:hypothetical protein